MTDTRETMCEILMCLDPHPPSKPDYAEALRLVEEWLAANPEWISITDTLPPQAEPVMFRYFDEDGGFTEPLIGWWAGMHTLGHAISMETGTGRGWYPCTQWRRLTTDESKA